MDVVTFEELLARVALRITYQDTKMRPAIPPAERLAITLRFLATGMNCYNYIHMYVITEFLSYTCIVGESFQSLQYLYRVPAQTIGRIVPETCQAIVEEMQEEYMKVNDTYKYSIIMISN